MVNKRGLGGQLLGSLGYKYAIDVFSPTTVSGWCFQRFDREKKVVLVFTEDEQVLGECVAEQSRKDLKAQGLHPSGNCGFSFTLPALPPGAARDAGRIVVSIKNSGAVLCVLNRELAGKLSGRPMHPLSRFVRGLSSLPMQHERVVFMHIPKTAGTSFNTFARALYPTGKAISHIEAYTVEDYPGIAEAYDFISGHLSVGLIQAYFPREKYQYYTLMREPYAQLHSHFNWLRGIGADQESPFYQGHHPLFKKIADRFNQKLSLDESDLAFIVDSIDGLARKLFENSQTRYFMSEECEIIEPHHFEQAQENMNLFAHIGLSEQLDAFKAAFCNAHHFAYEQASEAYNTSRYQPLYDTQNPVIQEILFPLVEKDLMLYEQVRRRCEVG